ncbi:MAG TPA: radical SAM protein [Bacteroidales bacterium]|nr:radical SAM protein [Bacteroidales bacterium]
MSILFHDIIYGPIKSRRFGYSLGMNLLPDKSKLCSYNCIYCECGWNPEKPQGEFVDKHLFFQALEQKLISLLESQTPLDVLTYAGNGEPTLHPDFPEIVLKTIALRNNYFPQKEIVLLTNGTTITSPKIKDIILQIEKPVLKLDSAIEQTMRAINLPSANFNLKNYLEQLYLLKEKVYIQTMFLKGNHFGTNIDNTTNDEVNALIEQYKKIQPKAVMLYSLDRVPPLSSLIKVDTETLRSIANKIEAAGIKTIWV